MNTIIAMSKNRYTDAAIEMNKYYHSIPNPKSVSFGVIEKIDNEYGPNTRIFNKDVIDYILKAQFQIFRFLLFSKAKR